MLLSDEIISNSKWVAAMQLSDRIGRRLKLQDLHVLMTVVQAGTMGKAAATPQHHPAQHFADRSRNWSMRSACACSTATARASRRPNTVARYSTAAQPYSMTCARA